MNALKIAAIGMAVLIVSVGAVAAAPGNAPSGTPADDQADSQTNTTASGDHGATVGERGPPSSLPAPVPDFVGEIHDAIGGFIDGTVEALGEMVSGFAGGDHAQNEDPATNTTTTAA
ncbi:MAG: hypothetical protein ABEJ57_06125 [Halobacteriaceae archaeon]